MIFYAGCDRGDIPRMKKLKADNLSLLLSAYALPRSAKVDLREQVNGYDIFLDSGAFSLKNVKNPKAYSIDDYCELLTKYKPKIYATFDVIGDPEKTLHNTMYLYEKGFTPLPVIQLIPGMNVTKVCEPYIRAGLFKHIAIGNIVGMRRPNTECCSAWEIIRRHWPVKVHAFGNSTADTLYRFPWYSFDSTSWRYPSRFRTMPRINTFTKPKISTGEFKRPTDIDKLDRSHRTTLDVVFNGIPRQRTTFTEEEYEKISMPVRRDLYMALIYSEFTEEITTFWKQKGIVWNN